jgi:hypothetical protein
MMARRIILAAVIAGCAGGTVRLVKSTGFQTE